MMPRTYQTIRNPAITTWDDKINVNNGINYKSTGAGFFPSTVSKKTNRLPTIDFQGIVGSLWGSKAFRNLSRTSGEMGWCLEA